MSEDPKPGTRVKDGLFEYLVCGVLNSDTEYVKMPCVFSDQVIANSKVEPVWPLGIYVAFTPDGISIGIFGTNAAGEYVNGMSSEKLEEDVVAPMGKVIWDLWKQLRNVPEPVLHQNFERRLRATQEEVNKRS